MSADYPELVRALLSPQAYPVSSLAPGHTESQVGPQTEPQIEMVETYISYIFFTGRHVYKVKKPVDYGFLDFTTLEKRRYYCNQEVKLDRRISPEVYLGVVEIRNRDSCYSVEGPGETLEYAVKMRQLPKDWAMNSLLRQGKVSAESVRRIAAIIADFHRHADTGPAITPLGDLDAVRLNTEENFTQTRKYVGVCLPQDAFDDLVGYARDFMAAREGLFRTRAAEGRVKDCHGDLHSANIFRDPGASGPGESEAGGTSIIDCIEFNERFRCSDVAEDIAFLAMDLDFHGRHDLSEKFVRAYVEESGDAGALQLLDFFKTYRAYVRGKVSSFRLDDASLSNEDRDAVLSTARAYSDLAHSYIQDYTRQDYPRRDYTRVFSNPTLVLVAGITGTGKSTVAQEMTRHWGLSYVSSDITRKTLAGLAPEEHRYLRLGEGIYAPDFSRLTYDAMLQQAEERLREGHSVVMDATFRRSEERERAVEAARRLGADAWVIECFLSEEEARRRLERRFQEGTSVSDGRWELYHHHQQEWEPVAEVPGHRHVMLDTGGSLQDIKRELIRRLYSQAW